MPKQNRQYTNYCAFGTCVATTDSYLEPPPVLTPQVRAAWVSSNQCVGVTSVRERCLGTHVLLATHLPVATNLLQTCASHRSGHGWLQSAIPKRKPMPGHVLMSVCQVTLHPQAAVRTRPSQFLACRRRASSRTLVSTSGFRQYSSGDVKQPMRQHAPPPHPSNVERSSDGSESCVQVVVQCLNHADMPRMQSRWSAFKEGLLADRNHG